MIIKPFFTTEYRWKAEQRTKICFVFGSHRGWGRRTALLWKWTRPTRIPWMCSERACVCIGASSHHRMFKWWSNEDGHATHSLSWWLSSEGHRDLLPLLEGEWLAIAWWNACDCETHLAEDWIIAPVTHISQKSDIVQWGTTVRHDQDVRYQIWDGQPFLVVGQNTWLFYHVPIYDQRSRDQNWQSDRWGLRW